MEKYSFENNHLTLIDKELNLACEESFSPQRLPSPLAAGQNEGVVVTANEAYVMHNNVLHGEWGLFYPSGKRKMEGFYQNGKLHGPMTFFSKEGAILTKSWYLNGKQQGKCFWYYISGAVYALQRFSNGHLHGKQEYFYSDGTPKTILHYQVGQLVGRAELFAPDGTLVRTCAFSDKRT